MNVIESFHLRKVFEGETVALRDINLKIEKDKITTLLGVNGSGKTTLLRILSTELLPTSGSAEVLGLDLVNEEKKIREKVAMGFEKGELYSNLSVWEHVYYYSRLRDTKSSVAEERAEAALRSIGLWDMRKKSYGKLSKGQKRKVSVSMAIASDAEIFLLDEPTTGLDPLSKQKIRKVIRQLAKEGHTLLVSTHDLGEAERISDKLLSSTMEW